MSKSIPSARFVHPHALMSIKNMELRARVVVEGIWNGLHRSPYHGFSVEFTEYRQYTAGDDTRFVDWRLVGRTDRYYIKKFEDETNLRCYFLVDQSRSMDYGSAGYTKAEYASTLAATLGYFLELQSDAIGLLTFADTLRDYLPARHRPGHLRQFMLTLEKQTTGDVTNIETPLQRISELVRKRGLIVIISDFFTSLNTIDKNLRQLRAWGHEVALFQTLDRTEIDLNMERASLFRDVESSRELYIDPKLARRNYLQKLETHNEFLKEVCRGLGVSHHLVPTDKPMEKSLQDFLVDRRRFGKSLRRTRSPGTVV
jgi:uncharacterized protein (DUF58 family)